MEDKKSEKISIDDLCKDLQFEYENQIINIKNGNNLLKHINKINKKAINFEKIFSYTKDIIEKEEKNIRKFIPLFEDSNSLFFETISRTIKNTIEPSNEIKIENNVFNNVFILNKIPEEEDELCFEVKLGQSLWDNINDIKINDINHINKFNKMKTFKIGLLNINEKNIKFMSNYLTISLSKEIISKCNWISIETNLTQEKYDDICLKYENYHKNIFYFVDLTNFLIPIGKNENNNNDEIKRFIQKNDIIGISIKNSKFKEYIEVKIFINGLLINSEIIRKEKNLDKSNDSDIDDDYNIEKKKEKNNNNLIPFIEIGANKSIFIKDKPNINDYKDIKSYEKMKYFRIYKCLPLNNFTQKTLEIQILTDLYLDILMKVGSKIFCLFPNEIQKYFDQLIIFFDKYVFKNKTILKYNILNFLYKGINLANGNILKFKENIKTLFFILGKSERKNDEKISIAKLIVDLLIELIIESNFELINDYKMNENNRNEDNQLDNLRKKKFALFFILFDNFIIEDNNIKSIIHQSIFLKEDSDFINFYYAIFGCSFYKDSINSTEYLQSFYDENNKFSTKKFLEFNFNKSIILNENYEMKLFNEIIPDYKSIIENIKNNIKIQKKKEAYLFFKFLIIFSKTDDNISIINFIIIQLIKNYFKNNSSQLDKDKSKFDKLIFINYIDEKTNNYIEKKNEDTFLGKYDASQISKKFPSLQINDINDKEIKDALFFDLILNCISNYYENFVLKENNAKIIIENMDRGWNSSNLGKNCSINRVNHMVEFYQSIFSGNFYINLIQYGNYLIDVINLSMKNNYLDALPYKPYLQNILLILKFLKLRCSFVDKNNILYEYEPKIISSIIQRIFKYSTEFLGKLYPKIHNYKFSSKEKYEEVISLHIRLLIEVLYFDIGAIKHSLGEVKDNLILLFKNLLELYDNDNYKIIYNDINTLITFLYNFNSNKEHAKEEIRKVFFKDIMAKEIEEFNKIKNESELKNDYIGKTMYFSIFMIIYKRIKIIRDSLKSLENKSIYIQELLYEKKYLLKLTQMMNILHNFLSDNKLNIFYDVRCISFLKINSFICKTFKALYREENFKRYQKIYEEDNEVISNFFTQFFFLLSKLLLKNEEQFDYNYKIAKNRKGFYFEEFKKNFEKYFGYPENKMMVDFLEILLKSFKKLCKDDDTLKAEDIDDNSIEIDQRDFCPICLDYTDNNKSVHLKDCNHIYHLECLNLQIKKKLTICSLCKKPITGIKEDPNFKVNPTTNNNYEHSPIFGPRNANNIFLNTSNTLFSNNNQSRGLFSSSSNRNSSGNLFGNNINSDALFSNNNNNISLFNNESNDRTITFASRNNSLYSLFEAPNNNTNSGLLGNTSNNTQGGGLFGNTSNNTQGLFGNTSNNTQSSRLFGNNSTQGNSLFGNTSNNTQSSGLFRNTSNNLQSGGLFGNTSNNTQTSGLFGNSSNNSQGGGLFGNNNNNNQGGGLFGNTSNSAQNSGLFGNTSNSAQNSGLFGNTSNNTQSTGLFGNTSNNTQGGGLFGNTNSNSLFK